jgi:hypothetical protein
MAGPFYNATKGTTAGTPGTGAFTPNAASTGFNAWSTVPSGWIGLVRYEDGSAWELSYGVWNGTTVSRPAGGFVASSTAAQLTLTSAVTAAMVADANSLGAKIGFPLRGWQAIVGATTFTAFGFPAPTVTGTAGTSAISNTSISTSRSYVKATSATTANAQAGISSATVIGVIGNNSANNGGWELSLRFTVVAALPTGPRIFMGLSQTTFVANVGEPSALVASYAILGKDSTDTNLQFMTNSNAGAATKTDTGIALANGGVYDLTIWQDPGAANIKMLLMRIDSQAVFYKEISTDLPVTGNNLPMMLAGLSGTTGTAIAIGIEHYLMRSVV